MRILIPGGAGFVGSTLAVRLADEGHAVTALDNLSRAGSHLNLERLENAGVAVVQNDVRHPEAFEACGAFGLVIDAAAEPSVHAGEGADANALLGSNLTGSLNALEAARINGADVVFLSTNRVYPIAPLNALPLDIGASRFDVPQSASGAGWSGAGVNEGFPLDGRRSLYGASKLAAETLVVEYGAAYGLRTVVNRLGVVAGPWQMGRVDQGFVALWAARHLFGGNLAYRGFGGEGRQVRDVLHVDDLVDLIVRQIERMDTLAGSTFNVGGGRQGSVSLRELTTLCRARGDVHPGIERQPETDSVDLPWYVTDNARVMEATGWAPRRPPARIVDDVFGWLRQNRQDLAEVF